MLICLNRQNGDHCSTENKDNAKYCQGCGKPLDLRSALPVKAAGIFIKRYRIIRMLGHGAFGAVYEATDTQNMNRRVALKETLERRGSSSFRIEFNVLQSLKHDHLPIYYDTFEEKQHGYLVMELVPGQDLKAVLKRVKKPLLENQVLGYAIQICSALNYLHSQIPMILHRDIKPANIRLTPDGLIKLVDFGLLKVGDEATRKSRQGWTPAYAPFEQWAGGTDPRSDLYSLGATLYHLLTNRVPFSAPHRMKTRFDSLRPPQKFNSSLSPHVAQAIMMAMALNPKDRFANATEMMKALVDVGAQPMLISQPSTQFVSISADIETKSANERLTVTETITTPHKPHLADNKIAQGPPSHSLSKKTFIVSQTGKEDYKTIGEAIQNASDGSHILVRPGLYEESLIIDKPLNIIGDGPLEDIIVKSIDASCLRIQSKDAHVRGLTLRGHIGPERKEFYVVDISQGNLLLEECDISSDSLACVAIYGRNTNPIVRRCKIHDGEQAGVFVYDHAQGKLEECDIFANTRAGIVITQKANPLIQNCRIHDGKANGIYIYYKGQGRIEECKIFGNAYDGIAIKDGGNPIVLRCQIYGGKQSGVRVYKNGRGMIEACEIFDNAKAGVEIKQAGDPLIRQCKIHSSPQDGILVGEHGQGTIEECEIFNNAKAGVRLGLNANPVIQECQIKQNKYHIVKEDKNSVIRLEKNDLTGDPNSTWHIEGRLIP